MTACSKPISTPRHHPDLAEPIGPELLSFREIPAAVSALGALETSPDLLPCDGKGLAHPRRCGLACRLSWLLDGPAIGIANRA